MLQLAHTLAAGRTYTLLVASDRRLSIDLLRASGVRIRSVRRGEVASESAVFAENGVDVGLTAMRDIHLLSFAHHLIGSFGSTFTMLIQELVAYRQAGSTVTYCEPGVGCLPARALRGDWHYSLQQWPKASIIERASGGGSSLQVVHGGDRPKHDTSHPNHLDQDDRVHDHMSLQYEQAPLQQRQPSLRLVRGHCGVTVEEGTRCSARATRGAWVLPTPLAQSWRVAARRCAQMCLQCEPCRYVSVSRLHRECSWYSECNLTKLHTQPEGFFSFRAPNAIEWRRLDQDSARTRPGDQDTPENQIASRPLEIGRSADSEATRPPTPSGFVRIDFHNRSCCSAMTQLNGKGRMIDRWKVPSTRTLTGCLERCTRRGPSCMFVSHMASSASEVGECRLCNLCQLDDELDAIGGRPPCSSWSRKPAAQRFASTFALQRWLPAHELAGPYSRRVYGAPGRAPSLTELRLVWIDSIGPAQRATIGSIGVCSRAGGTPLQPLFASVLRNALWVFQPHLIVHAPVPSYAWAEVEHCLLRFVERRGPGPALP